MTRILLSIQIVVIVLKLSGVLMMSWWLVLAPALAFAAALCVLVGILWSLSLLPDEAKK